MGTVSKAMVLIDRYTMPLGLKKKIYDARGSKKEAMALIDKYTPYGGFKEEDIRCPWVQRRGHGVD
jgi:hypothetical protein